MSCTYVHVRPKSLNYNHTRNGSKTHSVRDRINTNLKSTFTYDRHVPIGNTCRLRRLRTRGSPVHPHKDTVALPHKQHIQFLEGTRTVSVR
jgi:hypothetical protein